MFFGLKIVGWFVFGFADNLQMFLNSSGGFWSIFMINAALFYFYIYFQIYSFSYFYSYSYFYHVTDNKCRKNGYYLNNLQLWGKRWICKLSCTACMVPLLTALLVIKTRVSVEINELPCHLKCFHYVAVLNGGETCRKTFEKSIPSERKTQQSCLLRCFSASDHNTASCRVCKRRARTAFHAQKVALICALCRCAARPPFLTLVLLPFSTFPPILPLERGFLCCLFVKMTGPNRINKAPIFTCCWQGDHTRTCAAPLCSARHAGLRCRQWADAWLWGGGYRRSRWWNWGRQGEFEVKKKSKKKHKKVGVKSHRRETRRQKLPSAPCAFHFRRALSGGTNPIMSPLGVSEACSHFNCCCSALTQAPNYFEAHWSAQTCCRGSSTMPPRGKGVRS